MTDVPTASLGHWVIAAIPLSHRSSVAPVFLPQSVVTTSQVDTGSSRPARGSIDRVRWAKTKKSKVAVVVRGYVNKPFHVVAGKRTVIARRELRQRGSQAGGDLLLSCHARSNQPTKGVGPASISRSAERVEERTCAGQHVVGFLFVLLLFLFTFVKAMHNKSGWAALQTGRLVRVYYKVVRLPLLVDGEFAAHRVIV